MSIEGDGCFEVGYNPYLAVANGFLESDSYKNFFIVLDDLWGPGVGTQAAASNIMHGISSDIELLGNEQITPQAILAKLLIKMKINFGDLMKPTIAVETEHGAIELSTSSVEVMISYYKAMDIEDPFIEELVGLKPGSLKDICTY